MTDTALVIARFSDLSDDGVIRVVVGRHALALYNVDGEVYASDDLCNHGKASLSDGFLEDGIVECPLHGGTFDVRNGLPCSPPAIEPMKTYKVEIRGGDVVLINPSELGNRD